MSRPLAAPRTTKPAFQLQPARRDGRRRPGSFAIPTITIRWPISSGAGGRRPAAVMHPTARPSAPDAVTPPPSPPAAAPRRLAARPPASPRRPHGERRLAALLRGLGLPAEAAAPARRAGRNVGAMLREATAGTIDVLMARALTKRESRIEMTMLSPRANNPLKFFPNADGALTQMLTARCRAICRRWKPWPAPSTTCARMSWR
jgi:predicted component of type VI protein secretion system